MRLIDADAIDLQPDGHGVMNKVLFVGRSAGKTLRLVQETLKSMIDNAPTIDAVPVVRCKDCKHLMFSDFYGECGAGHYGVVRPDHFCSYGERKSSLLNKGGTEE